MTIPVAMFDPVKYKETTREQWQTAAEAWHRWGSTLQTWLGPATEKMLDLTQIHTGSRVLDVAAGAGEQTLVVAKRVGPSGHVLATDISATILGYAAESAAQAGYKNIETRVLDGENLDVPEHSFDAVISRVGLIYFPDQQKALAGMRRALKLGGCIGAIVYSTADHNPFFSVPVSIIRRRAQLPPPLPGQPGPFSLGNADVLEGVFKQAGFKDIQVHTVPAPLRMASAKDCVRFEKESFGALHQMLSGLTDSQRQEAWAEIEQELKKFEVSGAFEGPCELLVAVGVKP